MRKVTLIVLVAAVIAIANCDDPLAAQSNSATLSTAEPTEVITVTDSDVTDWGTAESSTIETTTSSASSISFNVFITEMVLLLVATIL